MVFSPRARARLGRYRGVVLDAIGPARCDGRRFAHVNKPDTSSAFSFRARPRVLKKCTDNFTGKVAEISAHARAIGTRPSFLLLPGLGTRLLAA